MSQSYKKQLSHKKILENNPFCIYCGGKTPSCEIDHMPARVMFPGKDRPSGLEFASCSECNRNTSKAELLMAWLARGSIDFSNEAVKLREKHFDQLNKDFNAMQSNIPGLREELGIGKFVLRAPRGPGYLHLLYHGGPILNAHATTFSAKFGIAMYHEITGSILPEQSRITATYWKISEPDLSKIVGEALSNFQRERGTLSQGRKTVAEFFDYQWSIAPDHSIGFVAARFWKSLFVLCWFF